MFSIHDPLEKIKALGSTCSRSNHCCRFGSGFVIESDIVSLAAFLCIDAQTLQENCLEPVLPSARPLLRTKLVREEGKTYGTCVFFHPRIGCTVHPAKPLHCRIGNCSEQGDALSQWYFANYVGQADDPHYLGNGAHFVQNKSRALAAKKQQ